MGLTDEEKQLLARAKRRTESLQGDDGYVAKQYVVDVPALLLVVEKLLVVEEQLYERVDQLKQQVDGGDPSIA